MGFYVRHEASFGHDTGGHPENAARLVAIEQELAARDWLGLEVQEAPPAGHDQLLRVHSAEHLSSLESLSASGGGRIDMDTIASAGSWEAALHAAGGAAAGAELLVRGEHPFGICALRPPGHHAERARAMGFCLLNNVAVACAHALETLGCDRALVLDWDVHHGNGTEEIFYESERLLFASIHESPLYPGTGAPGDIGSGAGSGFNVNLPVPGGTDGEAFLGLLHQVVAPIARDFEPQLLAVSAGYDAHRADPLGSCTLEDEDYGAMAAVVRSLADELAAPVLVCLEGGYDTRALAGSVAATVQGLSGERESRPGDPDFAAPYRERLAATWPQIG
ncbi:MAG: histone deacetylase family protein [Solirubrobacterales bacterium]